MSHVEKKSTSSKSNPDKIDVIMITKNSERMLEKCLDSIYQNVPVNDLIAVDGLSTDGTLSILHNYYERHKNIRILTDKGTRATARQKGIENVKTEWFMFVDSDVLLCKNWFERALKYIDEDAGAVWGFNFDVIPNMKSKLFKRMSIHVAKECFKIRGGMHDTLIRYEAVKDIQIPKFLHAYEDWYIIDWIKKKGYRAVIGDDLYCLHYRPSSDWSIKESINLASLEIRHGLFHSHTFKYMKYYSFFSLYWFMQKMKSFKSR